MGLLTDAGLDSGAYRNRLLSSTNGLSYWDESVGRRQFAWDTVNNRWQLTYSDTGWRNITASMTAVTNLTWTSVMMRRQGTRVDLTLYATTTAAASGSAYTVPTGFRFRPAVIDSAWVGTRAGATLTNLCNVTTAVGGTSLTWNSDALAGTYYVSVSYLTDDAWPASLPGVASGSIPFA